MMHVCLDAERQGTGSFRGRHFQLQLFQDLFFVHNSNGNGGCARRCTGGKGTAFRGGAGLCWTRWLVSNIGSDLSPFLLFGWRRCPRHARYRARTTIAQRGPAFAIIICSAPLKSGRRKRLRNGQAPDGTVVGAALSNASIVSLGGCLFARRVRGGVVFTRLARSGSAVHRKNRIFARIGVPARVGVMAHGYENHPVS